MDFLDLIKLKNFSRLDFYVTEQNQKKLLADIPNSTKNWVSAKILKKDNVLQDIQLRLRGDNPDNWLKFKKTFRIVQPNNDITEFTVNNRLYDDKSKELQSIDNDISLGQHDIRIVSGSTLPSNKMAEYNMYLDAYKLGLVDDVEVLKKTEIYDKEGVLQRKGTMNQMQSYIKQLEQEVKKLRGDLQTSEREMINARKQTITQKFKSGLDNVMGELKEKERKNLNRLENVIDKADLQARFGQRQEQGILGAEEGVEG